MALRACLLLLSLGATLVCGNDWGFERLPFPVANSVLVVLVQGAESNAEALALLERQAIRAAETLPPARESVLVSSVIVDHAPACSLTADIASDFAAAVAHKLLASHVEDVQSNSTYRFPRPDLVIVAFEGACAEAEAVLAALAGSIAGKAALAPLGQATGPNECHCNDEQAIVPPPMVLHEWEVTTVGDVSAGWVLSTMEAIEKAGQAPGYGHGCRRYVCALEGQGWDMVPSSPPSPSSRSLVRATNDTEVSPLTRAKRCAKLQDSVAPWMVVVLGGMEEAEMLRFPAESVARHLDKALRALACPECTERVVRVMFCYTLPGGCSGRVLRAYQVVVVGAHTMLDLYEEQVLLSPWTRLFPSDAILLNTEVIGSGSPWARADYLELLRRYTVWDVSSTNAARLRAEFGVTARAVAIAPMGPRGEPSTPFDPPDKIHRLFMASDGDWDWLLQCGEMQANGCVQVLQGVQDAPWGDCPAGSLLLRRDPTGLPEGVEFAWRPRHAEETVPVGFIGTLTGWRNATLAPISRLVSFHSSLFRSAWEEQVGHTAVSLSLRAYGLEGESKLPRLLPLLQQGAFIVSEASGQGSAQDDSWIEGIVVAPRECVAATTLAYLSAPGARQQVIEQGSDLFEAFDGHFHSAWQGVVREWLSKREC
jgi:hypothetical protein